MLNIINQDSPVKVRSLNTDPSGILSGTYYYNSQNNKLTVYENNNWVTYATTSEFNNFVNETRNLSKSIAIITDTKTSGTDGGTFISGSWQTRELNNISDPLSIVTSLSSNQVTLPAGRYEIEAVSVGHLCGLNKIKIRNVTNSTDLLIGTNTLSDKALFSSDKSQISSHVNGVIVLNSATTISVQHRASKTRSGDGFGLASSLGVSEIYTILKIRKLTT